MQILPSGEHAYLCHQHEAQTSYQLLFAVDGEVTTKHQSSRLHEASVYPSTSGSEQDTRGTSREVNLTLEGAGDSAVVCVPQQKYISDCAAKKKCLRQIKIPLSTF